MKNKTKPAGRSNSRIKRKPFKHFSETDRVRLEILVRTNFKNGQKPDFTWLGKELGFHRTTIAREYQRGLVTNYGPELKEYRTYAADKAQQDWAGKATEKGPRSKLTNFVAEALRRKILDERLSPYAAVKILKEEGELPWVPSARCVYNAIDGGLLGISRGDLPYKPKRRKKPRTRRMAYSNARGRPISERPKEADERSEPGHFEGDLLMGPQGTKTCLLVLVDRYSRLTLICRLPDATQKSVAWGMARLEKEYPEVFKIMKTITFDNGPEFLDYKALEWSKMLRKKRCDIFYAAPYRSSDRPSVECCNRLIRRFVPNGLNIAKLKQSDIKEIQDWINRLPRKLFDGLTAQEQLDMYIKGKVA